MELMGGYANNYRVQNRYVRYGLDHIGTRTVLPVLFGTSKSVGGEGLVDCGRRSLDWTKQQRFFRTRFRAISQVPQ